MGYADEPLEEPSETLKHGDSVTPVFREGALIEYTGWPFSALSNHDCLLLSTFIRIPRGALLMYVDSIFVVNSEYLNPDSNNMWSEQHDMIVKTLNLTATAQGKTDSSPYADKTSVMHRFLYDNRVIRTADAVTNLHLDFHYVTK